MGVVGLAAVLIDVSVEEVLGDDSPTTAAINAVAWRLTALRRAWRAGAGT